MYRLKKILALSIFAIFLIFVSGCGNSKNLLLGEWNAEKDIDVNDIVKFDNDKMIVNGKEYNFNIKSIEKKDDVIYYKIEKDGELFTVLFLFKEDRNIAYMLKPYTSDNLKEGKVIYSMHKVSNKN
ncbi:glycosyltransferase [Gemella sanguinis]|jgi:lipoprotein|uniref:Glycosyltransferase n=1 Tax=Gemella sanguinis TaxID=84135 RepID=A0A2N6SFA5_9BACL|nr:glycosyltransferase [Gemella sanguinis]PMC52638.1 glycosyltransferase [Gemella sanguinis]